MLNWFGPTGKPVHCLLTKADKLTRSEQAQALRAVQAEVADAGVPITAQLFSSLKKTGLEEAESVIGGWLGNPEC
jgi:GTP-binding protein